MCLIGSANTSNHIRPYLHRSQEYQAHELGEFISPGLELKQCGKWKDNYPSACDYINEGICHAKLIVVDAFSRQLLLPNLIDWGALKHADKTSSDVICEDGEAETIVEYA